MYGYGTATGDEMNGWDSIRDDNNSGGVDNVLLDDIEKMLMTEQEDDADVAGLEDLPFAEFPDDFLNDLLIDSADVADHGKESNSNSGSSSNEEKADDVAAVGDDPITKKHRRQLRNRDAAVRSRERKKMYVKDLEMKSRYLEGECRRLGILLQCCSAENQALRLSLHYSKAFDASMTKQESAVLVLESLLLGSLLWFLGIVCLFRPLPPPENVGDKVQESLVLPERSPNHDKALSFQMSQLFIMSRSCKGSRWRMKQVLLV